MDSEIIVEWPMFRIYKSGRIERLLDEVIVPPSLDPQNGVVSKDTVYLPENNLSLRIFLPHKAIDADQKLPLLVYFHGGAFIIETPFSPIYHPYLTSVVAAADCIAVSVDYRLAPDHPIPIPYEDSWAALKWVFTHLNGSGSDDWLNKHADFSKVFLAGDSAGGNITHHMGMRAGKEKLSPELSDSGISGIILAHPYFWSKTPIDEQETKDVKLRAFYEAVWRAVSPNSIDGIEDPLVNVVASESVDLTGLGCGRVLVMVAEKDGMARQGLAYASKLERSGWKGEVKVFESKDEDHCFHLRDTERGNALLAMNAFVAFLLKGNA